MPETFTPYRDRPALDKGQRITWLDLESGMLFCPLAGPPAMRRVRGVPQFLWYGEFRSPAYMIGTEDAADGRPCGGVIGCTNEVYRREFLDDGRPVYMQAIEELDDSVEALRAMFTEKLAELRRAGAEGRRLSIAETNLTKLEER